MLYVQLHESSLYISACFPSPFSCNNFFFFLRFRLVLISLYSTTLLGGSSPRKPNLKRISGQYWTGSGVGSSSERNSPWERKDSFLFMPWREWTSWCQLRMSRLSAEASGSGISGIRQPALVFCLWPEATGSSRLHLRSSFYNGDNNTSKVCSN